MPDSQAEFRVAVMRWWPTVIADIAVDGADAANAAIGATAEGPPDGDAFAAGPPEMQWLKDRIDAAVRAYLEHHTEATAFSWRLEGETVVRGRNAFQAMTNRPGAYLTGFYFVTAPERETGLKLRGDVVTNAVTLVDPRHGMNMNAIKGDPYEGQLKEIAAEPGRLVMWPGFVNHWTSPNHSDAPLIAVRFDVVADDGPAATRWQRLAVAAPDPQAGALKDGFIRQWPTYVLRRELEEYQAMNDGIVDLVTAMDDAHDDITADYLGVDLFGRDAPPIRWLGERITETVNEYLAHFVDYDVDWQLQGWPNINRAGDYHAPHNHCWCYLSGTYYVRVPDAKPGDDASDVPSGAINFADPRPAANLHAIAGDPYDAPFKALTPEPGTMLIWPASLVHNVYPNMAERRRISVSFNVVLEWDNRYVT